MHLFYTPDIKGQTYTLDEAESKHCIKVLRLNVNDIIFLIDGVGGFYTAAIKEANPKHCKIEVLEKKTEFGKRNFYLHIAVAPTKNIDRIEWFLEKATEIGIDEITPLLCKHSERKIIRHDRLNRVITSAVKQSLKAYHPKLNEMTSFEDFIRQEFKGQKFIAHCDSEGEKKDLKKLVEKKTPVLIIIGPEGDFSPEEIALAREWNFREVSLGESRLRTETAGIVACHTVSLLND